MEQGLRTRTDKGAWRLFLRALAVLLAAAIMTGLFPAFTLSASAEGKLSIGVDYDYYGTPFVKITPSSEENVIRYTLDGTKPTFDSLKYELGSEFQISGKTTVRAAEFTADGKRVSGVKKTVTSQVAPVEFDFEYRATETVVRLSCATAGAKIHFTTDGTKPNKDSRVYVTALHFKETTKVRAYAVLEDYTSSAAYSATAKIQQGESEKAVKDTVKYKTTYMSDDGYVYITVLPKKTTNIVYYTTDGSEPSTKSTKYSKRVKYSEPGVFRALEYTRNGEFVASLKLNVAPRVMPVQFSCVDFALGTRTIELTSATPGTTIYYTLDGTKPNVAYSSVYTSPVVMSNTVRIQAFAVKDEYKDSLVSSEFGSYIPVVVKDFNEDDPKYDEVVSYINERRRASGLSELFLDLDLCYAATVRAKETTIEFTHNRPNGQSHFTVLDENELIAGFSMEAIGTASSARDFTVDVLSRKDEAAVLLTDKREIDSIGVGYYEKNGKTYWVLIAARLA
ncbi:MAG: chitobiase/beta-hexosaminidase C-terminal domain-containing protein [Bacteroides sp.]|nr:chitobiase/beta-hexosaminidase C-terminal domain-containing protein [Eubacterium sp.]MCM1419512.1 chitobiase/beta-hexosaminidase C-terminal domain-containing protein [Roseburia sp.]MCM1463263.1 chitobiase/beta-hexosaminidase C-terminal domain-containing protein [Bacteroides sp.]